MQAEMAHTKCKWCAKVLTIESDGSDLRSPNYDSIYITCPYCMHSTEYNAMTDIWYQVPDPPR
jgi:RNase P subunit RPR2